MKLCTTDIVITILVIIAIAGIVIDKSTPITTESRKMPTIIVKNEDPIGQYSNAEYGLSFSYPDEYVLSEEDVEGSGERTRHVITLINRNDMPFPENGEGPPAITIDLYQNNLDNSSTEDWIRSTSWSNFNLSEGRLASTSLGMLPALSYRWSGLYEGTTIVTTQSKWVYVFTVTYARIGDPIVQDFVQIRDSTVILR